MGSRYAGMPELPRGDGTLPSPPSAAPGWSPPAETPTDEATLVQRAAL